jgi:hypothetical protein
MVGEPVQKIIYEIEIFIQDAINFGNIRRDLENKAIHGGSSGQY